MELIVKMKLNPTTEIAAKFEAADFQDIIRLAGALLDFDGKCAFCSSTDISIQTRITKEKAYKFTEYCCRACGARRPLGKYQDGGGFFLKAWEEKYEGGNGN